MIHTTIDKAAFQPFYKTQVTVERQETTQGTFGAEPDGEAKPVFEGKADVQDPTASQINRAGALGIDVTFVVYLPTKAEVRTGDEVRFEGWKGQITRVRQVDTSFFIKAKRDEN